MDGSFDPGFDGGDVKMELESWGNMGYRGVEREVRVLSLEDKGEEGEGF